MRLWQRLRVNEWNRKRHESPENKRRMGVVMQNCRLTQKRIYQAISELYSTFVPFVFFVVQKNGSGHV
jgi:hypothetical protein